MSDVDLDIEIAHPTIDGVPVDVDPTAYEALARLAAPKVLVGLAVGLVLAYLATVAGELGDMGWSAVWDAGVWGDAIERALAVGGAAGVAAGLSAVRTGRQVRPDAFKGGTVADLVMAAGDDVAADQLALAREGGRREALAEVVEAQTPDRHGDAPAGVDVVEVAADGDTDDDG